MARAEPFGIRGSSPRGRGTPSAGPPSGGIRRFIPAWAGNTCSYCSAACSASVHPRVGGEHPHPLQRHLTDDGSSPRGRGTPPARVGCAGPARFIPAWAGNTGHQHRHAAAAAVHPRVGGEHRARPRLYAPPRGSSPRGRGTLAVRSLRLPLPRFIPAWAGNTQTTITTTPCNTVHPRVGGEHQKRIYGMLAADGSSPRGRGTPVHDAEMAGRDRFIPAWAGNTSPRRHIGHAAAVHPRVGGEHLRRHRLQPLAHGSSPRGRGTPWHRAACFHGRRFIPAWAGNTNSRPVPAPALAVHPRVGGEHTTPASRPWRRRGSSPRGRGTRLALGHQRSRLRFIPAWAGNTAGRCRLMRNSSGSSPRGRGTHRRDDRADNRCRFIPAWAGNTSPICRSNRSVAVHPRVGGEHQQTETRLGPRRGSSPRGRGTPLQQRVVWLERRFIPAWAGNTAARRVAR